MDFKSARFYCNKTQAQIEKNTGVFASKISLFENYGLQLRDEKKKIERYLKVKIDWEKTGVPKMPEMEWGKEKK